MQGPEEPRRKSKEAVTVFEALGARFCVKSTDRFAFDGQDRASHSTHIDFEASSLVDQISRIDGVGEVVTLGSSYAMRIWLNPEQLEKYALMPSHISTALTSQNTQVSAGSLGSLPAVIDQQLCATITARR